MYLHRLVVVSCLNIVSLRDYRGILLPKIVKIVLRLLKIWRKVYWLFFFWNTVYKLSSCRFYEWLNVKHLHYHSFSARIIPIFRTTCTYRKVYFLVLTVNRSCPYCSASQYAIFNFYLIMFTLAKNIEIDYKMRLEFCSSTSRSVWCMALSYLLGSSCRCFWQLSFLSLPISLRERVYRWVFTAAMLHKWQLHRLPVWSHTCCHWCCWCSATPELSTH